MVNKPIWILGREYDLNTELGRKAVMDLIDSSKAREASGDLSMICYALIGQL